MIEMIESLRKAKRLSADYWSQGPIAKAAYREVQNQARGSVVAIRNGEELAALGTIVGSDGWVLTKASVLLSQPKCQLSDGRIVVAEIVGVDRDRDLALLNVPATELRAIKWADSSAATAGTFVTAPGFLDLPLAIGVVSVSRRGQLCPPQVVFEHDMPLTVHECGGPVVDLAGKAIGITIVCAHHGCTMISGDCIERLLPDLKSGKRRPAN